MYSSNYTRNIHIALSSASRPKVTIEKLRAEKSSYFVFPFQSISTRTTWALESLSENKSQMMEIPYNRNPDPETWTVRASVINQRQENLLAMQRQAWYHFLCLVRVVILRPSGGSHRSSITAQLPQHSPHFVKHSITFVASRLGPCRQSAGAFVLIDRILFCDLICVYCTNHENAVPW